MRDRVDPRRRRLVFAVALTSVVLAAEVVGGIWAHSLALLSDAAHVFTDLISLALSLGAIVLATGFDPYKPMDSDYLGYGQYPNVITAMEFERIINASGPTKGHVLRPSDGKVPKTIAFIQSTYETQVVFGEYEILKPRHLHSGPP